MNKTYTSCNSKSQRDPVVLESLLEGFAEYYSKNLPRAAQKDIRETALQCKYTGGTTPIHDVRFGSVVSESVFEGFAEYFSRNLS